LHRCSVVRRARVESICGQRATCSHGLSRRPVRDRGMHHAWMPRSSPGHAPRATGPTSGPRVASYSWYACVIHGGSTVLAAPVRRPQPRPAPSADTRRAAWQASSTRGRLLAPRRTRAPTHLNGISWIWSARGHPTAAGGRSDDHCPNPETSSPRPAGQLSRDSCRL
jgi:hypothetical protein